ncbi:hypothetical protein O181_060568 [Austropuccinia psidii MF-1]|uniref:Uncharacterized protein n=1 Tax=Austropuccinia psidii MF-1 TaxID=1389203 RepID=A0A9Q3HXN7_9BASI|nr:hypothetical protein [Austropuccinia psidii MF-1]
MPIQHSPPGRQTISQARTHAFLTPTPNFPLDGNPEVPQLSNEGLIRQRSNNGRRIMQTTLKGSDEEEDNYVEEEDSDVNETSPAPVGESQGTGAPSLSQSNQPVSHQFEPSSLALIKQMAKIIANHQSSSYFEASRHPL